jgi:dinuclear metal center YbgI/SA1388 family protein
VVEGDNVLTTVADVADFLERFAPRELAAEWDNVGLLLGDRSATIQRVMTCLTVTPDTVAEAQESGAHLIVTHHPIFFRAVKRLTCDTPEGRLLWALTSAHIAVYSPHTAFDNTDGGINDILARRLELVDVVPLRRLDGIRQCKVVVFVPDTDLVRVSDAMFAAGAGHIGQYSQCSFRLAGTGTFYGSDATNPTVGQKGRREEVSEWRLEAICPEAQVEAVIAAMRKAHSYEEPAYDVYPLRPMRGGRGEGRIGRLTQPMPLTALAQRVKTSVNALRVQIVGDPNRAVQKVAIACGAGGEFLAEAARAADVLLTGEMRFHDYLAAQSQGLCVVLPGHYASERCGVEELAQRIQQQWPDLQAWASRREHDPVSWAE